MATEDVRPLSLKRDGDGLRIAWADGVTTFVTWRQLRKQCPCATCNDERSKPPNPFRVLTAQEVAAGPPAPLAMKAVGLYAYQISWNDGHATGIYTVASLRAMSAEPPTG
jgi:DUF971 family protein